MSGEWTHLDAKGQAHMVDVSKKEPTVREAVAEAFVRLPESAWKQIREGQLEKGDVGATARIAGILAAKKTSELIPLCHPLALSSISIDVELLDDEPLMRLQARVRTRERTGVEMEALTAVSVAALTVYDMAKALDKGITIGPIQLLAKSGGKSGDWSRG